MVVPQIFWFRHTVYSAVLVIMVYIYKYLIAFQKSQVKEKQFAERPEEHARSQLSRKNAAIIDAISNRKTAKSSQKIQNESLADADDSITKIDATSERSAKRRKVENGEQKNPTGTSIEEKGQAPNVTENSIRIDAHCFSDEEEKEHNKHCAAPSSTIQPSSSVGVDVRRKQPALVEPMVQQKPEESPSARSDRGRKRLLNNIGDSGSGFSNINSSGVSCGPGTLPSLNFNLVNLGGPSSSVGTNGSQSGGRQNANISTVTSNTDNGTNNAKSTVITTLGSRRNSSAPEDRLHRVNIDSKSRSVGTRTVQSI